MDGTYKVLTNAGQKNTARPIRVKERFCKLTLASRRSPSPAHISSSIFDSPPEGNTIIHPDTLDNSTVITDDEDDHIVANMPANHSTNKLLLTPTDDTSSGDKLPNDPEETLDKTRLSSSFSQILYVSDSDETNCSNLEENNEGSNMEPLKMIATQSSQPLFSSSQENTFSRQSLLHSQRQANMLTVVDRLSTQMSSMDLLKEPAEMPKDNSRDITICSTISDDDNSRELDDKTNESIITIADSDSDEDKAENDHFYNDKQISDLSMNPKQSAEILSNNTAVKLDHFFNNVPLLSTPQAQQVIKIGKLSNTLKDISLSSPENKTSQSFDEHVEISETESELYSSCNEEVAEKIEEIPAKLNSELSSTESNTLPNPSPPRSPKKVQTAAKPIDELPTTESNTWRSRSPPRSAKKAANATKSKSKLPSSEELVLSESQPLTNSDFATPKSMSQKTKHSYIEKVNISAKIKISVQIKQQSDYSSSDDEDKPPIRIRKKVNISASNNRKNSNPKPSAKKVSHAQAQSKPQMPKPHISKAEPKANSDLQQNQEDGIIDEAMQQILNDIYGKEWQTPQMLKRCTPRIKLPPRESLVNAENPDFSLFSNNIPLELESTRISTCEKDIMPKKGPAKSTTRNIRNDTPSEDESESDESESSLESETSGEWKKSVSSSSDDDGYEEVQKKKNGKTTRNAIKFVKPESQTESSESDRDIGKLRRILDSCEFKKRPVIPATPAQPCPTRNEQNTKRKLFTPRHRLLQSDDEDDVCIEEVKEKRVEEKKDVDLEVKLKAPIPKFLQPFNKRLEALKNSDFGTREAPSSGKKTVASKSRPHSPVEKSYGFLQSLDVTIAVETCHPDALKYRKSFKANKEELTQKLYDLYNEDIFNNKLDVPITWNKKLLNTAGRCFNMKRSSVRSCRIELSEKVLTSADRLRCTLIHELCHAAAWLFDEATGHGSSWKKWVGRSNYAFPELPKISTCHKYEIEYKYTYQCTLCKAKYNAHSKSKKVENIRCSICHGAIEVFLNKKDKTGQIVRTPVKKASGFALFVKEKYKNFKKPDLKHADVMKLLGSEFAALDVEEKNKY